LPEQAWGVIKDVVGGFKDTVQTVELKELIDAVEVYVGKVRLHILESIATLHNS
jgi:hypothetical protein